MVLVFFGFGSSGACIATTPPECYAPFLLLDAMRDDIRDLVGVVFTMTSVRVVVVGCSAVMLAMTSFKLL